MMLNIRSQTVIFAVLILLIVGIGGYFIGKNGRNTFSSEQKLNIENTTLQLFQETSAGEYAGTLEVSGYVYIEKHECPPGSEAFFEGDGCDPFNYAFFVIQETNRKEIFNFINQNKGNAFVAPLSIGLGCYQKDTGQIYSQNHSDTGVNENVISGDALEKLLKSTQDNPVSMRMTRLQLSEGRGAPQCYSHFRDFKVL